VNCSKRRENRMGLRQWLQRKLYERKLKSWAEIEENRLSVLERETLLKVAKLMLQRQKIELKWLKQEQERMRKKPSYIK